MKTNTFAIVLMAFLTFSFLTVSAPAEASLKSSLSNLWENAKNRANPCRQLRNKYSRATCENQAIDRNERANAQIREYYIVNVARYEEASLKKQQDLDYQQDNQNIVTLLEMKKRNDKSFSTADQRELNDARKAVRDGKRWASEWHAEMLKNGRYIILNFRYYRANGGNTRDLKELSSVDLQGIEDLLAAE